MKVALFKIGSIIKNFSKLNGISYEIMSCIKMLQDGGADVTAISNSGNSDENFTLRTYEWFKRHNNEFDKMIVINGAINYFGGVENTSYPEEVFYAMSHFKKEIIYLVYDPCLPLKDFSKMILAKEFNRVKYTAEDLQIPNRIHYITQAKNTAKCNFYNSKTTQYYPLEKYPLLMDNIDFKDINPDNCSYDLIYGGTLRAGKRENKIIQYYFGLPEDIRVQIFGNIKLKQFKKNGSLRLPDFDKAVDRISLTNKLQTSIATICIGDKVYANLDDVAQRFYESINACHVTFIDSEYDTKKLAYTDKYLQDFLYVKSQNELIEKLRKVKSDNSLFKDIVKAQYKDVISNFDRETYCKDFVNMINTISD